MWSERLVLLLAPLVILAQTPNTEQLGTLRGLSSVEVVIAHVSGPIVLDSEFQASVESKLQQSGMHLTVADRQGQRGTSTLLIETSGEGTAVGVRVALIETRPSTEQADASPRPTERVITWQRFRAFQAVQSAEDILAPFRANPFFANSFAAYERTGYIDPIISQLIPKIIELQAEAARRPDPNRIRDSVMGFVNELIHDWTVSK